MLYQYECYGCEQQYEANESIKADPQTICPNCCGAVRRIITTCPHIALNNSNTIGQLADKNWKKMGTYEKEAKIKKDGLDKAVKRREEKVLHNKISRMNAQQKKNYIEKGTI